MRKTLLAFHVCCSRAGRHFFASTPPPASTQHCFTSIFLSLQALKMKFKKKKEKKDELCWYSLHESPWSPKSWMRQTPQERGWDFKEGPVLYFTMMRHFYHINRPPWEKKIHTHTDLIAEPQEKWACSPFKDKAVPGHCMLTNLFDFLNQKEPKKDVFSPIT